MSKNKPGPPKNPSDYSSNWKQLQATLAPSSKRRKQEDTQREHAYKRRKVERDKYSSTKGKAKNINHDEKEKNTKAAQPIPSTTVTEKEIWFDDVDPILLEKTVIPKSHVGKDPLEVPNAVTHATKVIAMDCEMVGIGKEGTESILARVSIVNQHGHCIYDKFVRPREKVTDFRTHVSGVRPHHLQNAVNFRVVQAKVAELLKGRILVGHAIHNDLKVLYLDHPGQDIRDTQRYKPFKQLFGGGKPSLKKLTAKVLGVEVQKGEHNSVEDAQAAMQMYIMHRKRWEHELSLKRKRNRKTPGKKTKSDSTNRKPTVTKDKKKVHFSENS